MKIISHRGYWKEVNEKNLLIAFERSFSNSYGTETDVRDFNQELVISHDLPNGKEMSLESFLTLATKYVSENHQLTLALNIKSDGLLQKLQPLIQRFPLLDIFIFDMSVPDMKTYLNTDIAVFTRMSEYENPAPFFENTVGIWLDSFDSEWYTLDTVEELLKLDKKVCIVSPELHGRPYLDLWEKLKLIRNQEQLILCTDFPETAQNFIFKE